MPHTSDLRGFYPKTRPNWCLPSTTCRLTMNFFYFGRRFSAGTWPSSVNEWARDVGHGITSDRGLGRRSPPDLHSLTKNTSMEHKDRDFQQPDTRAAALGMQSYIFLFAERNFWLCVNRNFDTIFDPVLPEPNRIFGLLNLSIFAVKLCLKMLKPPVFLKKLGFCFSNQWK